MRLTKRIAEIFFAFIVACAVGGGMMTLILFTAETSSAFDRAITQLPKAFLGATALVMGASFLPASLAIIIGEVWKFTSWRFYFLSGLVIGVGVHWSIFIYLMSLEIVLLYARYSPSLLPFSLTAVIATSGAAAGLGYWWVAGRNAGQWRGKPVQ